MERIQGSVSSGVTRWPGGYAANFAGAPGDGLVRCCDGHRTPEAAARHGLQLLRALFATQIELWKTKEEK